MDLRDQVRRIPPDRGKGRSGRPALVKGGERPHGHVPRGGQGRLPPPLRPPGPRRRGGRSRRSRSAELLEAPAARPPYAQGRRRSGRGDASGDPLPVRPPGLRGLRRPASTTRGPETPAPAGAALDRSAPLLGPHRGSG